MAVLWCLSTYKYTIKGRFSQVKKKKTLQAKCWSLKKRKPGDPTIAGERLCQRVTTLIPLAVNLQYRCHPVERCMVTQVQE